MKRERSRKIRYHHRLIIAGAAFHGHIADDSPSHEPKIQCTATTEQTNPKQEAFTFLLLLFLLSNMELGPVRSGRDSFDVRVCTPNLCYICWDMMTFWHTTWTDQRQDPGAIVSGGATATPPISQSLMLIDLFRPTREFRRLICAQPCLSFTFFFFRSTLISCGGSCLFYFFSKLLRRKDLREKNKKEYVYSFLPPLLSSDRQTTTSTPMYFRTEPLDSIIAL